MLIKSVDVECRVLQMKTRVCQPLISVYIQNLTVIMTYECRCLLKKLEKGGKRVS